MQGWIVLIGGLSGCFLLSEKFLHFKMFLCLSEIWILCKGFWISDAGQAGICAIH